MLEHYLEFLDHDYYGWDGTCVCHDPDGDGVGRMDFHGETAQDVVDLFNEHLFEVYDA